VLEDPVSRVCFERVHVLQSQKPERQRISGNVNQLGGGGSNSYGAGAPAGAFAKAC
jgi:hypothetical protein